MLRVYIVLRANLLQAQCEKKIVIEFHTAITNLLRLCRIVRMLLFIATN